MRSLTGIFLASLFSLSISAGSALAGTDAFLGEIMIAGFNFCPKGWADMNGQLLPLSQNTALFSLLGTTYGGNGTTTFALPTATPDFAANGVALHHCIAVQGNFPSRP